MSIQQHFFPTTIYSLERTEYLTAAREVAEDFLNKRRGEIELNDMYPAYMTEGIDRDARIASFVQFVAQLGWEILNEQGYAMDHFNTFFTEMWVQEHHKTSLMEQHTHGYGAQISGFYFLDCPENSSRAVFYDPKITKSIIGLPERDLSKVTPASNMINFAPKPGTLILTNSWLPHSFTKNMADTPMRFIHFNIGVRRAAACVTQCPPQPTVKVIG